jgi:hypothetical protein
MSVGNSQEQSTETTNITKTNTFGNEDIQGDVANLSNVRGDVTLEDTSDEAVKSAGRTVRAMAKQSQDTASDSLEAQRRTAQSALAMGERSVEESTDTVEQSLASNTNTISEALGTVEWQGQQNAQKVSRALDAVESAKKGDSAETMQQLVKWGAIAASVGAAAWALRA